VDDLQIRRGVGALTIGGLSIVPTFGAAQSLLFNFEIESSQKRTSMARNLINQLSQAKYFEQLERQCPGTMFDHHTRKDKTIHSLLTKRLCVFVLEESRCHDEPLARSALRRANAA
jgi:hypothetical protein